MIRRAGGGKHRRRRYRRYFCQCINDLVDNFPIHAQRKRAAQTNFYKRRNAKQSEPKDNRKESICAVCPKGTGRGRIENDAAARVGTQ
jgi:hypothetical protein